MSDPHFQSTGTSYTATAGFLTAGLLFGPALLLISHPFGNLALYLSLAFSLICLSLAYMSWTFNSKLTIPVIGIDHEILRRWGRRLSGTAKPQSAEWSSKRKGR